MEGEGRSTEAHEDRQELGQIRGRLECLAKNAGFYKPGISEPSKMSEESKNVLNHIKHSKLHDNIKRCSWEPKYP